MTAALALLTLRGAPPVAEIPFEHLPGRILLKASLNGRPATAILDSGASAAVADARAALAAGAGRGEAAEVSGNGATKLAGWRATGLRLVLGGSGISVPVGFAVPLDEVNAHAARPLDAIVGCDLLRRYAVEIDYANGRLRLYDPAGYAAPRGSAASPLRVVNGRPVVEGELRAAGVRMDDVSMLIDTGLASGVDVGPELAARSGLADRIAGDVAGRPSGLGGASQARPVLGATGRVGRARFAGGLRMVLSPGGSWQDVDAKVGDGFLAHYDVALDLPHGRMSLRPNGR